MLSLTNSNTSSDHTKVYVRKDVGAYDGLFIYDTDSIIIITEA